MYLVTRVYVRYYHHSIIPLVHIIQYTTHRHLLSIGEIKLDEFYQSRNQLLKLEERLKVYSSTDHKISPRDIDGVCRSLGVVLTKKQIEVDCC